jgi:hypothetical protein
VRFMRTADRAIGDAVSIVSALVAVALFWVGRRRSGG